MRENILHNGRYSAPVTAKSCSGYAVVGHEGADIPKGPTCVAVVGDDVSDTVCNPAAPVQKGAKSIRRSWLIDTGCPEDLGLASCNESPPGSVCPSSTHTFETPAGDAESEARIRIESELL